MADLKKTRPENIPGDFFVDSSCIDCDTCRWMAPQVFEDINGQSAVYKQPSADQRLKAIQALISCPTASIGYLGDKSEILWAQSSFPILVEDNVYHCGYHAEKSFGASAYFIQRKQGNVLVDSPRFSQPLVKNLEKIGGVKYMFLTHKDDVADHQKFHDHFNCARIIHRKELCQAIPHAEIIIEVDHPVLIEESEDPLVAIPTPGHTEGHMVLNYKKQFLFSGDHLAYSKRLNQLIAFKDYCGYSWDKQKESIEKLIEFYWSWLLPGHGRRFKAHPEAFKIYIEKCLEWMDTVTPSQA